MQISLSVVGLGFDEVEGALYVYCAYGQLWYGKCVDQLRVRLGPDLRLGTDIFGLEFQIQNENFGVFPCFPEALGAYHRKTLVRTVGMLRRRRRQGGWANIRRGLFIEEDAGQGEISSDRQAQPEVSSSGAVIEEQHAASFSVALASEAGCTDKRDRLTARPDGFNQGAIDEIKGVLLATGRARP